MARIIPEKVIYFNTSYGEKMVYDALKALPDEYVVFYSVQWQQKNRMNGSIVWGESDFTVFHPQKGLLVIEVKSGGIELKNGDWIQTRLDTNESHIMKDPLLQANKSKYRFLEIINTSCSMGEKCSVQSAVWFTSIANNNFNDLPPSYNKDIILTEKDLHNTEEAINRVYKYYQSDKYTNISMPTFNRIIKKLAPEFDLIEATGSARLEKDYAFLRLTREQSTLLDYLIEQRKVTIQGPAGTGKTLLAIEEAKRLAEENRKVLFLCYNHFLYYHLNKIINHINIECYNLNSLLTKFTGRIDIQLEEQNDVLQEIKDKFYYDDIIIDEGQDFDNETIEFFSKYSDEKNGKFYVFYDKNQLLFQEGNSKWIEDSECRLVLSKNCRNTLQIAVTANNIIDIDVKTNENPIKGDMPTMLISTKKEMIISRINDLINKYHSEGFENKNIVILTLSTEKNSIINGYEYISNNKIVHEIDDENILFTTSKKFKGMECDALILIDINKNTFKNTEDKRNFYVAASRAKQKLDLIIDGNDDDIQEIANEIKDINLNNNIAKIATKLKVKPVLK